MVGEPLIQFRLDRRSGVPAYRQVVDQVRQAVQLGTLRPGDQLPTVRDVVKQIAINPNTVHRAYRELETRGVTEGRQGIGTFIGPGVPEVPEHQGELEAKAATVDGPRPGGRAAHRGHHRPRDHDLADRTHGGVMKESAIETVDLGRRYGRRWVLENCDLQVPVGTVTGLVGPNGAGKSTLMRLCAGLSRPTTGHVSILGDEIRPNGTGHLAHIGYLDQHRPMYRSLRVEEAMRVGRRLNTRWDDDAARTWIAELGVPPRARLSALSEGQATMVALVVCLAKVPEVVVLDEPLASLDPLARRQLIETLLGAVTDRRTTVFLSSHIVSELEPVCDHLVIMSEGRVSIAGSVESLLSEHHLVVTRSDGPPVPGTLETVSVRGAQRQSTSLVRGDITGLDASTQVLATNLEEIVLAYLANGHGETRRADEEGVPV